MPLASNLLNTLGIVTPDANQVYWVSYPACLIGPLPTFRGCVVNLPVDSGCDQHVATLRLMVQWRLCACVSGSRLAPASIALSPHR